MKIVRLNYLVFLVALATAHLIVTMSLGTSPAFLSGGDGPAHAPWLVALFAGWILAVLADLAMSLFDLMPLSFAGEAVLCNLGLTVLLMVPGGWMYLLCAALPPAIVLVKGVEELARVVKGVKTT